MAKLGSEVGRIEAVTVCVGYSDFLAEVAYYNTGLLDRWIICTTPDDEATREICRIHDLETLLSDDGERSNVGTTGSVFNKGRLVERALQHTSLGSWRLHLDADIVLPHQFRRMLEGAHLDTQKIYGVDRAMFRDERSWNGAKAGGWLGHTNCSINMPQGGISLGTRYALADTGYIPIGFFQLWHSDADEWRGRRYRKYPTGHGDAHRTDVQFALQWDRQNRELLPEIVVAHLQSEPCKLGTNWNGRKTKQFGRHDPGRVACPIDTCS